jgi:protein-S-isoprenylcysteine O-methyltransferase Ste14
MKLIIFPLITVYTLIILSLVWARIRIFKVRTVSSQIGSMLYDPIVAVQIIITYFHLIYNPDLSIIELIVGFSFYTLALVLFWWGVFTVKQLDFAFSSKVGIIVTTGPYSIIRHPFYASYIACWATSTLLFNSALLWISLAYLVSFYLMSAKTEERVILVSKYSKEYESYIRNIGMFLPRVNQWKIWLLELLKLIKR